MKGVGKSGDLPAADEAETVHGMAGAAPPDRRQVKEEKDEKTLGLFSYREERLGGTGDAADANRACGEAPAAETAGTPLVKASPAWGFLPFRGLSGLR